MQPQNNTQPSFNLPPAMPEHLPPIAGTESLPLSPEFTSTIPEQLPAPGPIGANQMPPVQPVLVPIAPPTSLPSDVAQTTQVPLPTITEDTDLIEKEWVHKAKQIVERNRDDPYVQSKELTGLKADYLQKRYNKTIKLSE